MQVLNGVRVVFESGVGGLGIEAGAKDLLVGIDVMEVDDMGVVWMNRVVVGVDMHDEVVHDAAVVVVVVDVQASADADEVIVDTMDEARVGIHAEVVDVVAMVSMGNVENVQVHDEVVVRGDSEVGVGVDETLSCRSSAIVPDHEQRDLPMQRSDKIAIGFPRQM